MSPSPFAKGALSDSLQEQAVLGLSGWVEGARDAGQVQRRLIADRTIIESGVKGTVGIGNVRSLKSLGGYKTVKVSM